MCILHIAFLSIIVYNEITTKEKRMPPPRKASAPTKNRKDASYYSTSEGKKQMEQTKIYLNTWGAYNDGCIGYGWMTPDEARNFIEEDEERDGGEWFIADIDNYLGVKFSSLEYCDVMEIIDTIETLENMDDHERECVIALMEYKSTDDVQEAIDDLDDYTFFGDSDEYHDFCDESIDFGNNEFLERYFDYDAFHRDCDFDIYEASNGICILG